MKPIKMLALVAFAIVICLANLGAVEIVTEDFESGSLPTNWTQEYITNTYDWAVGTGSTTGFPATANAGTYNAIMHNTNPGVTRLVMPAMDLSAYEGGMTTLEFYRAQFAKGELADNLKIYTRDAADAAWVLQKEYADTTDSWVKESIRLKGVSSTYQVAFEVDFSNKNGVALDDIKLEAFAPIKDTVWVGNADGADYANLGELFTAINTHNLDGAVTVFITSDITENAPVVLNEFDGGSLLIKAFGTAHTVSGSFADDALITLKGTDNVTFAGSLVTLNPDYVAPEDLEEDEEEVPMYLESTDAHALTFDNTSATNGTAFLLTDVEGNGSENIVFTNLNIDGATDGTSADESNGIAIWGNDLSGSNGSSGHSSIVISNVTFTSAAVALKVEAADETEMISGLTITNNLFVDENNIFADAAISTKYTDNVIIASNTFSNFGTNAVSLSYNNNETDTDAARAVISGNTFSNGSDDVDVVLNVEYSPKTVVSGNTFTDLTASNAINIEEAAGLQVDNNTVTGGTYEEVVSLDVAANAVVSNNTIDNMIAEKAIYANKSNGLELGNNIITNISFDGSSLYGNSMYLVQLKDDYDEIMENIVFKNNLISNITLNSGTTGTYSSDNLVAVDFYREVNNVSISGNVINNLKVNRVGEHRKMKVQGLRFWYGGNNVTLYHNTIAFNDTFDDYNNSTANNYSAIIMVDGTCANWDVQNNIFSNSYFGVGGDSKAYILYAGYNSVTADVLNHNAYDIEDASVAGAAIARMSGTDIYTLADWQTLTGMEANGTDSKVYFVDGLHLDKNSINDMTLRAPKITGIDTDFDGEERPNGIDTYIGADVVNATVELGDDLYINGDATVYCEDQSVSMTYSVVGTFADGIDRTVTNGVTAQWEHNGAIINDQDDDAYLVSQNGMRLTIDPINGEHEGTYRAMFTYQGAAEISTEEVEIIVKHPVHITQNLQNVITGCANTDVLSFGVEAEYALNYVWQKYDEETEEFVDITLGEEETFSNMYTIDLNEVAHLDAEGKYRVRVIGDELCATHHPVELTSDAIEVVVYDQIAGVKTTPDFDVNSLCQGQTLRFIGSIESGDLIGYKWQKNVVGNWVDIDASENSTATTGELVVENISFSDNGRYRCVAIGYNECQVLTNSENEIDIEVPDAFAIAEQPESAVVCKDESASFVVTGNNVGEIISYQWKKDGQDINVDDNEFADDAILFIDKTDYNNIGSYSCEVTAEDCNGVNTFTSDEAILYVLRETEITRQPTTVTANDGDDVTFSVEAHMKGIVPPYYQHDFQWYKGTQKLVDGGNVQGAKSSILTINNVEATDFADYYVVVTGQCGATTSNVASITEGFTIEIATQPQATIACQGSQAQFAVSATPSDIHMAVDYAWYFNGVKLTDDANYQGTTTETLLVSSAALALEGKYTVKCTSEFLGQHYEIVSDEAELDVQTAPEVALVSNSAVDVEEESDITLEISVNSESSATFQWMKDGVDLASANNAVYTKADAAMADAGTYTCKVTNTCGETVSDNIQLTMIKKTGTSVIENTVAGLRLNDVTPNPVQNHATLTIENRMASNVKVYLTDASGRKVATLFEGMLDGTKDLNIDASSSNLTSGVYMITMEANGTTLTKSFVIAK